MGLAQGGIGAKLPTINHGQTRAMSRFLVLKCMKLARFCFHIFDNRHFVFGVFTI
jgi:hypothetical protein